MNNENDTKLDTIKTGEAFKKLGNALGEAADNLNEIRESVERERFEITRAEIAAKTAKECFEYIRSQVNDGKFSINHYTTTHYTALDEIFDSVGVILEDGSLLTMFSVSSQSGGVLGMLHRTLESLLDEVRSGWNDDICIPYSVEKNGLYHAGYHYPVEWNDGRKILKAVYSFPF